MTKSWETTKGKEFMSTGDPRLHRKRLVKNVYDEHGTINKEIETNDTHSHQVLDYIKCSIYPLKKFLL